jgi:hypothetical protein
MFLNLTVYFFNDLLIIVNLLRAKKSFKTSSKYPGKLLATPQGQLLYSHISREYTLPICSFDKKRPGPQDNLRVVNFVWFLCTFSTLLHLPPLIYHCVRVSWDRTEDCDFGIDSQTL